MTTTPDYDHLVKSNAFVAAGSLYKWSIATLVTANGGALLGLMQHSADHYGLFRAAGKWFGAGLIAVILGAIAASILSLVMVLRIVDTKNDLGEFGNWTAGTMVVAALFAASAPLFSLGLFTVGGLQTIASLS